MLIAIIPEYDDDSFLKRWAAGSEEANKLFCDLIWSINCDALENKIQYLRVINKCMLN